MKKQIKLHNKKVDYILKFSKRAKRMRLTVYCDGSFVVTKPYNLNKNTAEEFIIKKANWILSKLEYFDQLKNNYFLKHSHQNYSDCQEKALIFVNRRIKKYNSDNRFAFNKINIKNQKTRWGSCSQKGNLNFNYKIIFLPIKIADYIIIHELCHLKEFNHSQKFWNLVAEITPDYLDIRKKLNSLIK
ncbi:MAG: SprT family zinc-dependent metalloprotease [bacterium]